MSKLTINLKTDHFDGSILFDLDQERPNEKLILETLASGKMHEPDVSKVITRVVRNGDVVFDVGANVGFFTVLPALLVGESGHVISFEPGQDNRDRMVANLSLNGLENVTVVENPVSNKVEETDFYINSDDSGGNALWDPASIAVNTQSKANPIIVRMTTTTLDKELKKHKLKTPKLIKVDTEGADQFVLEGAAKLLKKCKVPFVIAELHNYGLEKLGCSQESLRGFMEGLGYSTYIIYRDGILPKFIPPATKIHSQYVINLLFSTPEEVGAAWPDEVYTPSD